MIIVAVLGNSAEDDTVVDVLVIVVDERQILKLEFDLYDLPI